MGVLSSIGRDLLRSFCLERAAFVVAQIFGPLVFLMYTNGLSDDLVSQQRLFADNSSIFSC